MKDNDNLSQAMHVHVYGLETRLQYLAGAGVGGFSPFESFLPVIHHANCRTRVETLDCIKINLRGSIKPKHFWGECP